MSPHLSRETLGALISLLLKRSSEAYARAEAMRLLLQKHGLFSEAEFDALYQQLATEATGRAEQLIDRLKSAENDAAIHRWLRDFEGTKQ